MKSYANLTPFQRVIAIEMERANRRPPKIEPYSPRRRSVRVDWGIDWIDAAETLSGWLLAGVITFAGFYLAIQIARFAWNHLSAVLAMAGLN